MGLIKKFWLNNTQKKLKTPLIDTSKTSEKFLYLADEILPFVLETLKALCALEEKYTILMKTQKDLFIEQSWGMYTEEYRAIISPVCTEKLFKKGYADCLSKPATYAYVNSPDCQIDFIMKSNKKAIIESRFNYGIYQKHQFTIIETADGWKIDAVKCGFDNDTKWNNYHI